MSDLLVGARGAEARELAGIVAMPPPAVRLPLVRAFVIRPGTFEVCGMRAMRYGALKIQAQ
jgi:hypothetical protein